MILFYSFPPSHHPVLAFKGAPASFPVLKRNRHLQKYLVWSDTLMTGALEYITHTMDNDSFIAVHLRIGSDWVRVNCMMTALLANIVQFRHYRL